MCAELVLSNLHQEVEGPIQGHGGRDEAEHEHLNGFQQLEGKISHRTCRISLGQRLRYLAHFENPARGKDSTPQEI